MVSIGVGVGMGLYICVCLCRYVCVGNIFILLYLEVGII